MQISLQRFLHVTGMSVVGKEEAPTRGTVLLFRAPKESENDLFEKELLEHNFIPVSIPVLEFNFINIDELSAALGQLQQYSAIVFTSQQAVEAAVLSGKKLTDSGAEINFCDITCYIVGGSTAKAASQAGFNPENYDAGNAEKLAEHIIKESKSKTKPILYPCGNLRKDTLSKKLKEAEFSLHEIEVYETMPNKCMRTKVQEFVEKQGIPDYVVYFSPSGVQYTTEIVSTGLLPIKEIKVIAIGPTTEKELRDGGIPVFGVANTPNPKGVLQAMCSKQS